MDRNEYEIYRASVDGADEHVPHLSMDMVPAHPRTLTYGYTIERDTVHVYIHDGEIHYLRTNSARGVLDHQHGASLPAPLLKPSKRAMPEHTDLDFAIAMADLQVPLTFTTYAERRYDPFECGRADNLDDYTKYLFEDAAK